MNNEEIIATLKSLSNQKYRSNIIKLGIPENSSLGVTTKKIRKLAKTINKSNELAYQLWNYNYHEAKLLAVLLFDNKQITLDEIKVLITNVTSWDLCDHLCKNLIIKIKGYDTLISEWVKSTQTYTKRAAFTLIASDIIHNKKIDDSTIDLYLELIKNNSHASHPHIKKAVIWALKEIGKKDFHCQEKSLITAYELGQNGDEIQKQIAKEAIKELENLIKVNGRTRLISRDSKMGQDQNL